MPIDLALLTNDLRQLNTELPVSFRLRRVTYQNGSFNPGGMTFDPVSGGIIEGMEGATLRYPIADLPKQQIEMDEDVTVFWRGRQVKFVIKTPLYGRVSCVMTLEIPEKG